MKKTKYLPIQETEQATNWLEAVAGDEPIFTPKGRQSRPFIKGPIPLEWMRLACRLNAAPLAIYIQWKAGLLGATSRIPLRPRELAKFGIGGFSVRRQFKLLVGAKLVHAAQIPGRCKAVRIHIGKYEVSSHRASF
jgi:hypothetical protein